MEWEEGIHTYKVNIAGFDGKEINSCVGKDKSFKFQDRRQAIHCFSSWIKEPDVAWATLYAYDEREHVYEIAKYDVENPE